MLKAKARIKGTMSLGSFWVSPADFHASISLRSRSSGFKPYVGAGVQYIHYFDGGHSDLGGAKIKLDNSWGFALQGGVDIEIGHGWYLNADIKKVWLDTDASWLGTGAKANVAVDPLIVSMPASATASTCRISSQPVRSPRL